MIALFIGYGSGLWVADYRKTTPRTNRVNKQTIFNKQNYETITNRVNKLITFKQRNYEAIKIPESGSQPSIEKVCVFRDKYLGQTLIFTGCQIDQRLEGGKIKGLYTTTVWSKGRKFLSYVVSIEDITFGVSEKMAEIISEDLQGGRSWKNCVISCIIQKVTLDWEGPCYLAVIDGIDIYSPNGHLETKYR